MVHLHTDMRFYALLLAILGRLFLAIEKACGQVSHIGDDGVTITAKAFAPRLCGTTWTTWVLCSVVNALAFTFTVLRLLDVRGSSSTPRRLQYQASAVEPHVRFITVHDWDTPSMILLLSFSMQHLVWLCNGGCFAPHQDSASIGLSSQWLALNIWILTVPEGCTRTCLDWVHANASSLGAAALVGAIAVVNALRNRCGSAVAMALAGACSISSWVLFVVKALCAGCLSAGCWGCCLAVELPSKTGGLIVRIQGIVLAGTHKAIMASQAKCCKPILLTLRNVFAFGSCFCCYMSRLRRKARSAVTVPALIGEDYEQQAEQSPEHTPVKRIARDGCAYTLDEFVDYYGLLFGVVRWDEAEDTKAAIADLPAAISTYLEDLPISTLWIDELVHFIEVTLPLVEAVPWHVSASEANTVSVPIPVLRWMHDGTDDGTIFTHDRHSEPSLHETLDSMWRGNVRTEDLEPCDAICCSSGRLHALPSRRLAAVKMLQALDTSRLRWVRCVLRLESRRGVDAAMTATNDRPGEEPSMCNGAC